MASRPWCFSSKDMATFGVIGDSGFRVSALMSHAETPVAMPWVPSPESLQVAGAPLNRTGNPVHMAGAAISGEGGPWPTSPGSSKWAILL